MDRERLPLLKLRRDANWRPLAATVVKRAAGIAFALLPLVAVAGEDRLPASVALLYLESNVGTASGGHVALRIGEDVFHYQHDAEGFVALTRDDWTRFRIAYNDRDNRNIHIARMSFGRADAERIRAHFVRLHLVQRAHLDFLEALRQDAEWLRLLATGGTPGIEGAGLFRPGPGGAREFVALRRAIAARYGEHYLPRTRHGLEARLASLFPVSPDASLPDVDPGRFAAYPLTFSAAYRELAARVAALAVLSGAWCLDDGVLLDPLSDGELGRGGGLKVHERARLEELAHRFEQASLSLLATQRTDGGYALLLALARLGAVHRSLAQDRLLLVDPFHGLALPPLPGSASRAASPWAEARFRQRFETTRRDYFRLDEPDEASLNVLENAAARYHYVRRELSTRARFAFPSERIVPAAARPVVPAPGAGSPVAVRLQVETAEERYRVFRDKIRLIYAYHLIERNCATELMRALNAAFPGEQRSPRAAGAPQYPEAGFAFIPFRLFDEISARADGADRTLLPSYRNRALAAFSARENPLWVHLTEATTATSALYERRRGDTLFLFFTEDWPWLRPLFGTVNLGYGLLNAGGGVFTAAIDGGERLDEGLRGALFSLPELLFFNIRKGSFEPGRVPPVMGPENPF